MQGSPIKQFINVIPILCVLLNSLININGKKAMHSIIEKHLRLLGVMKNKKS